MGLLNLCMKKNPLSRTFHLIVVLVCFVLLIFVAVTLGIFVQLHLDIGDVADSAGSGPQDRPNTCILFATPDRDEMEVKYQDDTSCDVLIWGHVAVGALAIAMGAVLIIKAFAGVKVFSVFSIVEFILTFLGFLFGLTLAVMVTIGLDDTCNAFEVVNELGEDAQFIPCEEYEYADDTGILFYGTMNTTRIMVWIEAVVLFIMALGYGFINLVNCCTWCRSRGQYSTKTV